MHSPERPSALRARRRRLALLLGAASLLGLGGSVPAQAQDQPAGKLGDELFGIYQMEARGIGVQGTYGMEGFIVSPVMDLALPETLARFGSGPSGYGLASLAYPGGLIANFGSLVAQGGGPPDAVPPYPIKAEAFYPAGPTEVDASQQGGTVQKAVIDELGSQVNAVFPGIDAPPVVKVGTVASASRSAIEGELAISRSRVELSDIAILGGVITIDSVITDLVSAHDGLTGSTNGGTVASGVKFLGLDAALTEDGLVLQEAAPVEGPAAPLGGLLGPAVDPLTAALTPFQEQLAEILTQATPQLDELLAQAGISISIVDPREEQVESGAATRSTSGLQVSMSYKGKEQEALVDLINAIPPELKPNLGPIPSPVLFLAENHVTALALAPASVSSLATPPFDQLTFEVLDIPTDLGSFDPLSAGTLGAPGFSTPPAPLPVSSNPAAAGLGTEPISSTAAGAVPAILVALALLVSPLFGAGSARLADNVLAPVSTSCPHGLDKPIEPRP